jgi:hypothetical protein
MSTNKNADRRRFPRYAMKDEVYLVFRPDFDTIGRLMDIGRGGFAVEYPAYEDFSETTNVEVDIFVSTNGKLTLRFVPCKVVYDVKDEQVTRRCGLEFEQPISEQHETLLHHFLVDCTSHLLPNENEVISHMPRSSRGRTAPRKTTASSTRLLRPL